MTFATEKPGVFTAPSAGGITVLVTWADRWACTECRPDQKEATKAALKDGSHPCLRAVGWRV